MSRSEVQPTRRRLLVVTGAATAATACSAAPDGSMRDGGLLDRDDPYLAVEGGLRVAQPSGQQTPRCGGVEVGDVSDHPVGVWRFNPGARAIIARDARGFFAYSAICSHEQCLIGEPDADGVTECPCHNSRFDGNGHRMSGPASTPLRHFAMSVFEGRLCVDPSMRVGDDVRAVPPDPDAGVVSDSGASDAGREAGSSVDATVDSGPVDAGPRDAGADIDPCGVGVDVGPVTMFMPNTWTVVRASVVVVARDARGLFAYSAACTHSGCTISIADPAAGAASCPCHGSAFDNQGHVTRGPASEPLDHHAVVVCAGRVRVDRSSFVAESSRTAIP